MSDVLYNVAYILLTACCALCLYRIGRGPTAPDRAVALDILGTLIVGFCCTLSGTSCRITWFASGRMSSVRSHRGGISIGITLRR